jgi:hypothetical protein
LGLESVVLWICLIVFVSSECAVRVYHHLQDGSPGGYVMERIDNTRILGKSLSLIINKVVVDGFKEPMGAESIRNNIYFEAQQVDLFGRHLGVEFTCIDNLGPVFPALGYLPSVGQISDLRSPLCVLRLLSSTSAVPYRSSRGGT